MSNHQDFYLCKFPHQLFASPEQKQLLPSQGDSHSRDKRNLQTLCWCVGVFTDEDNVSQGEPQGEQSRSSTKSNISPLLDSPFKPLHCNCTCDLSTQWKSLGRGGAMKQRTLACTCCEIHSSRVSDPHPKHCCWRWREWTEKYSDHLKTTVDNWQCYHYDILTDKKLNVMQEEYDESKNTLHKICDNLRKITQKSCITVTN